MAKSKPKPTAEEQFLEAWNEWGYPRSDITREYRFHPVRRWRFDFAFPSRKVAVEIDGRGRHQTVAGVRADAEKSNTACKLGWVILHLPTSDIRGKDKSGEPLVEKFIELLCEILSNRETYADVRDFSKRVEPLLQMPTPQKRSKARSVSRRNPGRSSSGRRGPRKD